MVAELRSHNDESNTNKEIDDLHLFACFTELHNTRKNKRDISALSKGMPLPKIPTYNTNMLSGLPAYSSDPFVGDDGSGEYIPEPMVYPDDEYQLRSANDGSRKAKSTASNRRAKKQSMEKVVSVFEEYFDPPMVPKPDVPRTWTEWEKQKGVF